jgi:hypothetical protein
MPEILRLLHLDAYQMLVFAGILLLMVLIRPEGVMGKHELWDLPFLRKYWKPNDSGTGTKGVPVSTPKAKGAL